MARSPMTNRHHDHGGAHADHSAHREPTRTSSGWDKLNPHNGLRLWSAPKSDKKKFKDRQFAAGVDREEVTHAAAEMGVDLKEHVQFVIEAMRGIAADLGLEGEKFPS